MPDRFSFDTSVHGQGGFAKVHKGRDNELERDVAVKVLSPLMTAFPEADRERFRREAKILAKLSHPNIPAIYDVQYSPDTFLIIFQFIEGRTLRDIIEHDGATPLTLVKQWFQQIASALDHAHLLGVVHRDIKPENIIITPGRETAYLVDFGIALVGEDTKKLTAKGFVIGTAGYVAPEQQAGENIDMRADIYSLGVSLYEALAGKRMPVGNYEELFVTNEAIPPEVDELIKDCLLPKEKRIPSAKAFIQRLTATSGPARPLSDILAHGRLHELASAIEELNQSEFAGLPPGQRALILAKLDDITGSGDFKLRFAAEEFLELLISRGQLLPVEDYQQIAHAAVNWAFQRPLEGHRGGESLRIAIEQAAYNARNGAHRVLANEFCAVMKEAEVDGMQDWLLHAVREVTETLLANPFCDSHASDLVKILKAVNRTQRERHGQVE